jgi:hypothetical protein
VLSIATIRTTLDFSSRNAKSITAEKVSRDGYLDSITSTENRFTEHEHDEIRARHERYASPRVTLD